MEFSRQEYWSGLPFPTQGDLSDPGLEPASPELAGGFFTSESPETREIATLSEVKSDRERQIPYDITYVWNLKYDTNELIYKRETDSQRIGLRLPRGRGGGGRRDWEFGGSRCKLLYTGWINNKVPQYNTGNYIQYPTINHNRKEYEKERIDKYNRTTQHHSRD